MTSIPGQQADEHQGESAESKYQFIGYNVLTYVMQRRKKLIQMVFENGMSVYKAAKLLGINNSTAKAIARKYRSNGTIFRRKNQESKDEGGDVEERVSANQTNLIDQQGSIQEGQNKDVLGNVLGESSFSFGNPLIVFMLPNPNQMLWNQFFSIPIVNGFY